MFLSLQDRGPVPMDLESEEEDKENGDNSENGVEDKVRRHSSFLLQSTSN